MEVCHLFDILTLGIIRDTIIPWLSDKDIFRFLLTCKTLYSLFPNLKFKGMVELKTILKSKSYHNFMSVKINKPIAPNKRFCITSFPDNMQTIHINKFYGHMATALRNAKKLKFMVIGNKCHSKLYIPPTVTHLTLNSKHIFKQKNKELVLKKEMIKNVVSLRIFHYSHQNFEAGLFSDKLKELYLGKDISATINKDVLPKTLKKLSLNGLITIEKDAFPEDLDGLELNDQFIGNIKDDIPIKIRTLFINCSVNFDIQKFRHLKKLVIGSNFIGDEQRIDSLSDELESFTILSSSIVIVSDFSFPSCLKTFIFSPYVKFEDEKSVKFPPTLLNVKWMGPKIPCTLPFPENIHIKYLLEKIEN